MPPILSAASEWEAGETRSYGPTLYFGSNEPNDREIGPRMNYRGAVSVTRSMGAGGGMVRLGVALGDQLWMLYGSKVSSIGFTVELDAQSCRALAAKLIDAAHDLDAVFEHPGSRVWTTKEGGGK